MAELSITYTPQISSEVANSSPFICHRVCYRLQGEPTYCCIEDTTDSVAGTPKVFVITIAASPCASVPDVDPEACTNTIYEGYVQACCEAEVSLSGRTPFSASFTADPSCINKSICCIAQRVLLDAYMVITDPGAGYDDTLTPLTVLVIRSASDPVAPGGGNDATIEATLAGGIVTALTVTGAGLYGATPLLVIPSPTLGPPTTTATAIAVVPCADTAYMGDCNTSPQTTQQVEMLLGECANTCLPQEFPYIYSAIDLTGLPDTTNFSYAAGGCCDCSTCRDYQVVTGSNLPFADICYMSCAGATPGSEAILVCEVDTHPGSGAFTLTCVVPGSIYCTNDPGAILSITDDGACGACP